MRTAGRVLLGVVAAVLLVAAAAVAYAWHGEIAPRDTRAAQTFPAEEIRQGAVLAALGNCAVCHTAPGGKLFAGGLAIATPFGGVHSTNITPDPETGIGRYSEAAFQRAMRQGVDREGRHLYPAFPYDHFTLLTDADNRALYAFLMSRTPVRAATPANDLRFPFNMRMLVAGWKLLFFREGPFRPDANQSQAWNRGAYLVEGLTHCGACHTPRNALGAERRDQAFGGGEAEGWTAYALNQSAPAPIPWDADALFGYLRRGWHAHHGVARGPMAPVAANLAPASDEDVRAIAGYVAAVVGPPSAERKTQGEELLQAVAATPRAMLVSRPAQGAGAAIHAAACAPCHDGSRPLPYGGIDLRLSSGLHGPTAQNLINVLMDGLPAAEGTRGPIMPGFAAALNDRQMVELLAYLRTQLARKPPWQGVEAMVRESRSRQHASVRPAQSGPSAPANPSPRGTRW